MDIEGQVKELEDKLAEAHKKIQELAGAEVQKEIEALKATKQELEAKLVEAESKAVESAKKLEAQKGQLEKAVEAAETLTANIKTLQSKLDSVRLEKRVADLDIFDISEEDIKEFTAEISGLEDEAYAKWLARAERVFKKKEDKKKEDGDKKKDEAKASEDNVEKAEAALESAVSNPVTPLFNGDMADLDDRIDKIISGLFVEEGK